MDYQNSFDTEVNPTLMGSKDPISKAVSTLFGGTVATMVDIGASIWNTLPGDEVDTYDLLSRIGGDPLRVYEEHPDAVRTASLIGGSILPGAIALKGMNLARNGWKTANWFTDAGQASRLGKLAQLTAEGAKETGQYKRLLWSQRLSTVANGAADAAAAEALMLSTLGAHPYLEDYWDDPGKNLFISLALGGGLGAVGGLIVDGARLRQMSGAIEEAAIQPVYKAIQTPLKSAADASTLQSHAITISNLDKIMQTGAQAGKTAENDLQISFAQSVKRAHQKESAEVLDHILSPELRALPIDKKKWLQDELVTNPEFRHVQRVEIADTASILAKAAKPRQTLDTAPTLFKTTVPQGATTPVRETVAAMYFPDSKLFGRAEDVQFYGGASALNKTEKQLVKDYPEASVFAPKQDAWAEMQSKSTPQIEADHVGWTLRYAEMDDSQLVKVLSRANIASDDVPQLEGLITRAANDPALSQLTLNVVEQSAGKSNTVRATIGELVPYLQKAKFDNINSMLSNGYPVDVIAKRSAMPRQSLDQFLAGGRTFSEFQALSDISSFKTAQDAKAALDIVNKPLLLRGDLRKVSYNTPISNLNTAQIQQLNKQWIGHVLATSSSPMVKELGALLLDRFDQGLAIVRAQMSKINNELMGSTFLSSVEHSTRRLGELGPILSVLGKDLTHLSNRTSQRLLEPITDLMAKVGNNEAALMEFNIAFNVNSGLRGFRTYKNGQILQAVQRLDPAGNTITVMEPVLFRGQPFQIKTPEADALMQAIGKAGSELYQFEEAYRKMLGQASNANIGLWIPSVNPVGKHIAYIHDKATDTTQMLYGRSVAELEEGIKAISKLNAGNPNMLVVRKGDQEWWSYTNGRADSINMTVTDVTKLKTGSAQSAIVSSTRDVLSEVAGGIEHYINASVRRLADTTLSDITDNLRRYSEYATRSTRNQPLSFVQRVINRPKDAGQDMLNIMLGNSMLGEYEGWQTASRSFDAALSKGAQATEALWKATARASKFKSLDNANKLDYEAFEKALKDKGVVNPFANIEEFLASRNTSNPELSKRMISATNGLVSTMALRFGELAHPLVNLMSMPILTQLAKGKTLPKSFMGVTAATKDVPTSQVMFEGVRAMHSPRFASLNKKWEELGYFEPMVSEATKTLQASRSFEKGAMAGIEKAIDSNFVKIMSKPADWSEATSRKLMMNTGYQLGKRLYPQLDDNALTIFARDFMDKALGNYSAAQRPVMFQGTLGMALGLFQTYMLSLAQAMYRNIEAGDWKNLAKGMLAQSTIFGASSMPGFEPVSQMIGEHFSSEHFDLTTGTYRAIEDPLAEWILYGLPSNLSQGAFYTRGDVDPRFPNVLAGVDNIVGVNMMMQSTQAVKTIARALGEGEDAGQAVLQALSLQSLSRPIARNAEVLMALTGEGGSLTQAGNTVQTSAEVLTFNGIASRIFAVRPMEEAMLREMQYKDRHYKSVDYDRRQKVVNELRTSFRNGTATSTKIAEIAEEYMRQGGSPTGWRMAYRNAQAKTLTPGSETFIESLDGDSALNHMIDSLE